MVFRCSFWRPVKNTNSSIESAKIPRIETKSTSFRLRTHQRKTATCSKRETKRGDWIPAISMRNHGLSAGRTELAESLGYDRRSFICRYVRSSLGEMSKSFKSQTLQLLKRFERLELLERFEGVELFVRRRREDQRLDHHRHRS